MSSMREKVTQMKQLHGLAKTRAYNAWLRAKGRCYNQARPKYATYGARGIRMAPEWVNDFAAFYAYMGECPKGQSLDRIDNDGPYAPGNCRWASVTQQARNKRSNVRLTHEGRTLCVADWAARLGISPYTIYDRIRRGETGAKLLRQPENPIEYLARARAIYRASRRSPQAMR